MELTLTYIFRIVDANGDIILPATTLRVVRNLPFDDRVVQAKEGEEATLFAQMQNSLIARIMRRISAPDIEARYRALIASNAPNASDVTNTAVPQPALTHDCSFDSTHTCAGDPLERSVASALCGG